MNQGLRTALKLLGVGAIYGVVGVLLYRYPPLLDDFLLFTLPCLILLLANVTIVGAACRARWNHGAAVALGIAAAVAITFAEVFAYFFHILNTYGS